MQKFTRFYGKVAYLGMISDFSTSLRFLFYELISGFQILISVISPRAYEISPSVGPLDITRISRESREPDHFLGVALIDWRRPLGKSLVLCACVC